MKTTISGHKFITSDGQKIQFKLGKLPGIPTEEILDVAIARLQHFQEENPDIFTFQAICDLQKARNRLKNREIMRKDRGVLGTSLPTVDYEAAAKYAAQDAEKSV